MSRPVKTSKGCWCFVCERPFFWVESVFLRTEFEHIWVCNQCWKEFDYEPYREWNKWFGYGRTDAQIRDILSKPYTRRPWVRSANRRKAAWRLSGSKSNNVNTKHWSGVDVENYKQEAVHGGQTTSRGPEGIYVRREIRNRNRYVGRRQHRMREAAKRSSIDNTGSEGKEKVGV